MINVTIVAISLLTTWYVLHKHSALHVYNASTGIISTVLGYAFFSWLHPWALTVFVVLNVLGAAMALYQSHTMPVTWGEAARFGADANRQFVRRVLGVRA